MAAKKVTVVLSQALGKSPAKRHLEEEIAAALLLEPNVEVSMVPHLYDLPPNDTGLLFLRGVAGDMIVLAWLFPRATRWVLDRQAVKGQAGVSLLDRPADDDEDDAVPPPANGVGAMNAPARNIYCLDLRDHPTAQTYIDEVKRIVKECSVKVVTLGGPQSLGAKAVLPALNLLGSPPKAPAPLNLLSADPVGASSTSSKGVFLYDGRDAETGSRRRWYPVIDYSRCTNCMECIDFCLFGVYGVDAASRILVEQQDNCKKGCPACSRVCPENAIIFPEYKSPAIAGAAVGSAAGIKIDLSKLFGGEGAAAIDMAVRERDRELVADGRTAVGAAVGLAKRSTGRSEQPRDELDDLVDGLDGLAL